MRSLWKFKRVQGEDRLSDDHHAERDSQANNHSQLIIPQRTAIVHDGGFLTYQDRSV